VSDDRKALTRMNSISTEEQARRNLLGRSLHGLSRLALSLPGLSPYFEFEAVRPTGGGLADHAPSIRTVTFPKVDPPPRSVSRSVVSSLRLFLSGASLGHH